MNATTLSCWLRSWLKRPVITPVLGGLATLGFALGGCAGSAWADDLPWRSTPIPRREPEPLPAVLPISPLAPRPGSAPTVEPAAPRFEPAQPVMPAVPPFHPPLPVTNPSPQPSAMPRWQGPRSNEGINWQPGRPMKPASPRPSVSRSVADLFPEVLPAPRLARKPEPEAAIPVSATTEPVSEPPISTLPPVTGIPMAPMVAPKAPEPVSEALPTVQIRPMPQVPPIELPKTIPLANDDVPGKPSKKPDPKPLPPASSPPKVKPSQKLAPPREMEPRKLPPVDLGAARVPPPSSPAGVWGSSVYQSESQPIKPVGYHNPPAMVPNKHGTFGSPNLSITRDRQILDLFRPSFLFDNERTLIPEAGPAIDRSFATTEYLLWWVNTGNIPVLAATGRGAQQFGYLGQPGTEVLLGPGSFGDTLRNGFRTRFGNLWDTPVGERGFDASFFFLGKSSTTRQFDSQQLPTISRPFFAPNFDAEFAQLVAFPGLSTGTLLIEQDSLLWGADVNYRIAGCRTCDSRSEWFAGYRFLSLQESIGVTEFIIAGPQAPDPIGTSIVVTDSFEARNSFHGAQVGWAGGRRAGRWDWNARFSVALGVTHQRLDIAGDQVRQRPGQQPETFTTGGLLAAGPNIGRFTNSRFSVVPEATFNLGYALTPTIRGFVGYNFLYWSNVIRPGDQIDRVIDLTFVPNGPAVPFATRRPVPLFQQADLWTQGLQFGLEARW